MAAREPAGAVAPGVHGFDVARLPAQPWRNGGGETRQVAAGTLPHPDGVDGPGRSGTAGEAGKVSEPAWEGDFGWRISIATIAADGPFSAFPGVDRCITLLSGPGVLLSLNRPGRTGATIEHRLDTVGRPYWFDGGDETQAACLGGASQDFNLMLRRRDHAGEVLASDADGVLAPAAAGLLLAVRGRWRLDAERGAGHPGAGHPAPGRAVELAAGQGVWWTGAARGWRHAPETEDSLILGVRIWLR